ncbi:MAG: hypothetical protein K2P84_06910 [Undibacterium sp.]|nr:hypothetical protein [Undibacterium sp.]
MKSTSKQYLYSVFRQSWQELSSVGRKVGLALQRTPLPRLLILCIGLALLLTILPLVLTLFVAFMLVKLFFLLVAMNLRSDSDQHGQAIPVETTRSYYDKK